MQKPTFDMKLDRIVECADAAKADSLSRNLLHAYAACLTVEELCEAAVRSLASPLHLLRHAFLNRLIRTGREAGSPEHLDQLGRRLLRLLPSDAKSRGRIDVMLSELYVFLSPPTRQMVLEQWKGRGKIGAGRRWLKAISNDDLLFEIGEVLAYWRATGSAPAAKLLAYRGEAAFLAGLMPDLVVGCDKGWIVGRAALRAGKVSEDCWQMIRGKFPATYAYLCAKTHRLIGEAEALKLVREAAATWPADDIGLAIWALGQLGMWSTLEKIRALLPEFQKDALARLGLSA
jgi:hypothetical protein